MKIFNIIKGDPSMLFGIGMTALGFAQLVLGNKSQAYDRKCMKAELRQEILDDLMKQSSK